MSLSTAIRVNKLSKEFRSRVASPGILGALRSVFSAEYRHIQAVSEVSFELRAGERVAFIGPNGAGKSTTIKMLTGIMHPSSGEAEVLGFVPWRERSRLSYQVGTVFGQRSQLWYHLPAGETFNLFAKIYGIEASIYKDRLEQLRTLFELEPLLAKPVRQLSLGERMRCEIAASMLHKPRVLLLDEPSIGLDVTAKAAIRDLIKRQAEEENMTVLLTSHDTGDMEQVCERVIVINHGRVLLDTPVAELRKTYIRKKYINIKLAEEQVDFSTAGVKVIAREPHSMTLEINMEICPVEKVVQLLVSRMRLRDLTVEDPPLEEIIKQLYHDANNGGVPKGAAA